MWQGCPDQGIEAGSCHLSTREDSLQTGKLKDWERYHDRRIHTTHQDCDSWFQTYHLSRGQHCISLSLLWWWPSLCIQCLDLLPFSHISLYPGSRRPRPLAVDECASLWPGCRPTGAFFRCHGLCPWGSTCSGCFMIFLRRNDLYPIIVPLVFRSKLFQTPLNHFWRWNLLDKAVRIVLENLFVS